MEETRHILNIDGPPYEGEPFYIGSKIKIGRS